LAAEQGVKVHTIGIGTDVQTGSALQRFAQAGTELDEPTLRAIADATGGRYFRARSAAELEEIGATLDELEPVVQQPTQARVADALYVWPLAAAMLISLLLVAQGVLRTTLQRLVRRARQP